MIAPLVGFSVRPLGRVPPFATEKVYGEVPPLMVMAGLFNAAPTAPELTAGQVSVSVGAMVMGQVVGEATPLVSFTWSEKVPEAVGVPVIAPVLVFSSGRRAECQLPRSVRRGSPDGRGGDVKGTPLRPNYAGQVSTGPG